MATVVTTIMTAPRSAKIGLERRTVIMSIDDPAPMSGMSIWKGKPCPTPVSARCGGSGTSTGSGSCAGGTIRPGRWMTSIMSPPAGLRRR